MTNPLHYPDLERCKKLTEIGFPFGDLHYFNDKIETTDGLHEWAENHLGVYDKSFRCPSVMEMLDVIPAELGDNNHSFLNMGKCDTHYGAGYIYWDYKLDNQTTINFNNTLPNALADLIFWLVENKYLSFNK